jgi:protein TonB
VFETVVPREAGNAGRKFFSLPVSIALHVILVAAGIAQALIAVHFPSNYPKLITAYVLTEAPPPPPPPPPPPAAAKSVPQQPTVKLPENMAPTIIPDLIPEVLPEVKTEGEDDVVIEGVAGGIEGGDPNGSTGGEHGGVVGGVEGGILTDENSSETVVVARDESLPMAATSQTYPMYPERARAQGWEDTMVVRYTIGKDGRVRLVEVLSKPQRDIFEKETVRAIRQWRFKPLIRDGEAKEVVHELTVNYELEWMQQMRAKAAASKKKKP